MSASYHFSHRFGALNTVLVMSLLIALPHLSARAAGSSDESKPDTSVELEQSRDLINDGHYQQALEHLLQLTQQEPDNADAWNLLGYTHRHLDDTEQSASAYQRALALNPEHKGALEYQGELFIRLGQLEQARANLDTLVQLCPDGCEERDDLEAALQSAGN